VHFLLVLLFFFLFITQTCIDKDNSTIIFQLCTGALSFNLALDSAEADLWVSATFYKWMHDISAYFILANSIAASGLSEGFLFNVFKEKKRMLKSPKIDIALNTIFVMQSWITSSFLRHPTCQLFFCLYTGFLLFRVHNYLHNFTFSDTLKPFPLLNLTSSALIVLLTVLVAEAGSIMSLLENKPVKYESSDARSNFYFCTFFTLMFAQFLHVNLIFSTHMFAEYIASY
jgi:hypothetical protein